MIHQRKLAKNVLIVGRDETAQRLETSSVAVGARHLADIVATAAEIADRHALVLFETDANADDLEALAACVEIVGERTNFVALTDDNLPLARVRALSNAGAAEVLPCGIDDDALIEGLQLVLARKHQFEFQPNSRNGSVISVAQARGGAGSTTVAVNLAVAMASDHKRKEVGPKVVVLDLDLQFGNAGTYLDVEDNGGLLNLISQDTLPDQSAILRAVQSTVFGVDVITAPQVFAPLTSMTPELIRIVLDTLRRVYDVVVVDLPHAMLDWVAPVISATDRLLLVSEGSVPCIRQAKRIIDLYRESQVTLPVDLVMNREKKPWFACETLRAAEELLGIKDAFWISENRTEERSAVDLGQPSAFKRSKARKTYVRLARVLSKPATNKSKHAE
jgi:pilus assembly protein CpaE